jgi:hypothetical protein
MPKIPMLTSPGVEPRATPTPGNQPHASPEAFGGAAARDTIALGRGMEALSYGIGRLDDQLTARADEAESNAAAAKFLDETREALQGENGFYRAQGEQVKNLTKTAQERLAQIKTKYGQGLSGGALRRYTTIADSQIQGHLNGIANHQAKEEERFAIQSRDALSYQVGQIATGLLDDRPGIEGHRGIVKQNTFQNFEHAPEAYRREQEIVHLTEFDGNILDAYRAKKRLGEAWEYFQAHREDMTPKAQAFYEATLGDEMRDQQAEGDAQKLEQRYPDAHTDRVMAAFAITDPDQRDKVLAHLQRRENTLQIAKRLDDQDRARTAWKQAFAERDAGRYDAKAVQGLANLDPQDRLAIEHYFQAELLAKAKGVPRQTNTERYYELKQLIKHKPQVFQGMDLNRERPYLSDTDLMHFMDIQQDPKKLSMSAAETSTIDAVLTQYGINEAADRAYVHDLYEIEAYRSGKPPATLEEVEDLTKGLIKTGYVPGSVWDTDDVPYYKTRKGVYPNWKPYAPGQWGYEDLPSVIPGRGTVTAPDTTTALPTTVPSPAPSAAKKPEPKSRHPRVPRSAQWNGDSGYWEVPHSVAPATRYDPDTGEEVPR